jgi:hypothetical protein
MNIMKQLRAEIEAYLKATGMPPTNLGIEVDGDRSLVSRIRAGRPVTMAKAERIMNYIRKHPAPKQRRPRRRMPSALSIVA